MVDRPSAFRAHTQIAISGSLILVVRPTRWWSARIPHVIRSASHHTTARSLDRARRQRHPMIPAQSVHRAAPRPHRRATAAVRRVIVAHRHQPQAHRAVTPVHHRVIHRHRQAPAAVHHRPQAHRRVIHQARHRPQAHRRVIHQARHRPQAHRRVIPHHQAPAVHQPLAPPVHSVVRMCSELHGSQTITARPATGIIQFRMAAVAAISAQSCRLMRTGLLIHTAPRSSITARSPTAASMPPKRRATLTIHTMTNQRIPRELHRAHHRAVLPRPQAHHLPTPAVPPRPQARHRAPRPHRRATAAVRRVIHQVRRQPAVRQRRAVHQVTAAVAVLPLHGTTEMTDITASMETTTPAQVVLVMLIHSLTCACSSQHPRLHSSHLRSVYPLEWVVSRAA
jgi:hypothetical protein